MNALRRVRLPHPFVLLIGGIFVAAILTWVFPAGQFDRQIDPTGTPIVIAGTYHEVDASPVGVMGALVAVPRGIVNGAEIIAVILLVGGAFALLDRTGALARLVGELVGRSINPVLVVALMCTIFSIFGAIEGMHEEIIALVPVLVMLSRRLGFGAITALGMSVGAAVVGSAFGPTNPFATGLALRIAELPQMNSGGLRLSMLIAATAAWIFWTVSQTSRDDIRPALRETGHEPATRRDGLLMALVIIPFVPYVYGVLNLGWGFNELSALFIVAGYAIGLTSGMGLTGTTVQFIKGMETMLGAALLVGIARGISVVLTDGQVIDTIVYTLAQPLETMPAGISAGLMVPIHSLLHVIVPSYSGQAVLTMPIFAPVSDLLGFSRDVAVLAFQTGAVLPDMLNPTNGALLAMLLAANVPFGRWLRFAVPGALIMSIVGFVGIAFSL